MVLAAGLGTRMKSDSPKVMHPLAGRPMVRHLLDTLENLAPDRVAVVVGPEMRGLAETVAPYPIAVQTKRLGTAHAVLAAREFLTDVVGTVLIVFGDTPLLSKGTLFRMIEARRQGAAVVVLGFRPDDPAQYGRLVQNADGGLERIVEFRDASEAERAIELCNSGVMAVDGAHLLALLDQVGNDNAKREYYLTDIVGLARAAGLKAAAVEGEVEELLGINSKVELAAAEAIVQTQLRRKAMDGGVTLTDPDSVHLAWDTKFGRDVTVAPFVVFGPGVTVGDRVEIRSFCHLERAAIMAEAIIGPYARLRPGATIGEGAHIGNFVEIKQSEVEAKAKVNHLSYIGDARIGEGANIGAGTITCNYDGFAKSRTEIGAGAFIGSNTALVAPVVVGDGAITGSGSVITRDVPPDALGVERADQRVLVGWAAKFRARKQAEKKEKG